MRSLFASAVATAALAQTISLNISKSDASYSVSIDGDVWLSSSVYSVRQNGKLYTSGNGGLMLNGVSSTQGNGAFGPYTGYSVSWKVPAENNLVWNANFYIYSQSNAIVFEQEFPSGLSNTAIDQSTGSGFDVSTGFPTFGPSLDKLSTNLAYLAMADCMSAGYVGNWKGPSLPASHFGNNGGLTVLYDASGRSLALSSLSDVMVSHFTWAQSLGNVFAHGMSGRVASLPAGFKHSAVLVAGQGMNDTTTAWGDLLLAYGGKTRTAVLDDFQTAYLSYWTDNGAYYYYHTLNASDPLYGYEATMVAVKAAWAGAGLPVRTFQYDSWWYFKEGGTYGKGAVTLWEPMPIVFPDGFSRNFLGLPVALHNRYFSRTNNYTDMGYTFMFDPPPYGGDLALPVDVNLFKHIMGKAADAWAMTMYEQDWLITVYQGMNVTNSNVTAASSWLHAMGDAAAALNLTIQYCMPLPNHMLASTAIQPVTNARASGDYHPGQDNWQIGLSSLFYQAIGIQPSKDDFWTTEVQPGSPYGDKPTEPNWQLEAIVATLSTGPVGPSDMIGGTNASVVLGSCRAGDGLLLRPDRPATRLDSAFLWQFTDGYVPEVEMTHSAHAHEIVPGEGVRWYSLYATRLAKAYTLTWADLGAVSPLLTEYVSWDWFNPLAPVNSVYGSGLKPGSSGSSLTIPTGQGQPSAPSSAHALRYLHLAPVLPNSGGWVILGEQGKYVPMSRQRLADLAIAPGTGFTARVYAAGPGGVNAPVANTQQGSLPRAVQVGQEMVARGLSIAGSPGESSVVYLVVPPTGSPAAAAMLSREQAGVPGAVATVTCTVTGGGIFNLVCDSTKGCSCTPA